MSSKLIHTFRLYECVNHCKEEHILVLQYSLNVVTTFYVCWNFAQHKVTRIALHMKTIIKGRKDSLSRLCQTTNVSFECLKTKEKEVQYITVKKKVTNSGIINCMWYCKTLSTYA